MALLGAVAFSGKAIIVKLAYRHGVDAITLLMLRMLLALPFFVLMAWWAGRTHKGAAPVALCAADLLGVVWLGFTGYYLASFLDFAGLAYISASFERLILYLNPTLVLVLGALLYRRRISAYQWLGLAISYAGVLAVFGHEARLTGADVGLGHTVAKWCAAWAPCAWSEWPVVWPAFFVLRNLLCCATGRYLPAWTHRCGA
jgi:drug/metabolite transporter (DMT)-like permease